MITPHEFGKTLHGLVWRDEASDKLRPRRSVACRGGGNESASCSALPLVVGYVRQVLAGVLGYRRRSLPHFAKHGCACGRELRCKQVLESGKLACSCSYLVHVQGVLSFIYFRHHEL